MDNFKLLFENQVDSIEELIVKISDNGRWDISQQDLYILFDRYYETPPFLLMDFVGYARYILALGRTM